LTFPRIGVIFVPGGIMATRQLNNGEIVTMNKQELYDLVKMAVYDALSRLDFLTAEEFKLRENAIDELKRGEAIQWNDYLKERGLI